MKKDILKNISILIGAAIIGLSILGGFYLNNKMGNGSKNDFVDPDSFFSGREFKKEEFLIGSGSKKVILLEYSDLECPFCKKLHIDTMQEIYKNYGSKVDIAFRHFPLPFHKKAKTEATATLCARDIGGQQAYKNYIGKIYEKTQGNDSLDLNTLPDIAKEMGLDVTSFNSCMSNASSSETKLALIESDIQDGISAGVEGTPNVFVLIKDGQDYKKFTIINGARDYKYVSKVIDQALKQ